MHTSAVLRSEHFRYGRPSGQPATLADLFPAYSPGDRLAIAAPVLEDGVLRAGPALLALTTAFYDHLRASGMPFFDYPAHFALLDQSPEGWRTRQGRLPLEREELGAAWGQLDVWPETQWIACRGTASGLLAQTYALHINHLFWPADLKNGPGDAGTLPGHARKLLAARLKSVHYYAAPEPTIQVHALGPAADMLARSAAYLPGEPPSPSPEQEYQQVEVSRFLADHAPCFC